MTHQHDYFAIALPTTPPLLKPIGMLSFDWEGLTCFTSTFEYLLTKLNYRQQHVFKYQYLILCDILLFFAVYHMRFLMTQIHLSATICHKHYIDCDYLLNKTKQLHFSLF